MIKFNKKTSIFTIETKNTSYAIKIDNSFLLHAYYGKKISGDDLTYLTRYREFGFADTMPEREKLSYMDYIPFELPVDGIGDFRETALAVTSTEGHNAIEPKYVSHTVTKSAPELKGLPCVFGKGAETLEIKSVDPILNVEVTLLYTIFSDTDTIVRSTKVKNLSDKPVKIKKCFSLSMDMDNDNYEMISLHGSWARERHMDRHTVNMGLHQIKSHRGESSHQEHPFVAVLEKKADWNSGNVYGVNFIYSGNFVANVQRNQFDQLRVQMGINPENFCWTLSKNEEFVSPQAVTVFSDKGLNGMSQAFHNLYRNHLVRSKYNHKMRPILINNWEATYFNFNTEKILDIAREASKDGIEMLVLDDGWFGHRNFDDSSLGDWFVNEEKLPGGLSYLAKEINKLGMKFGLWFEPEMISPDSELFKAHPDWAIQIPNRKPGLSRQQLVLDITRPEVLDFQYNQIKKILASANIEYIKWDMNRQLSDIGSLALSGDKTGEFFHRYVLAMYDFQNRLVTDFPNLLLENCSGGGARFDPGMFYFSPQIWCSDDTDAIERLQIQEGTALIYPLSTMGAHVSVCPNHAVGRNTPFKTRGYVALSGTFGYELDITKLDPNERSMIPGQIALYKKFNPIIREGLYYKVASYTENNEYDCWMSVKDDEALITFVQVLNHPNMKTRMIKLCGLDPEALYTVSYPDEDQKNYPVCEMKGETLMNAGLPVRRDWGDFQAKLVYLQKKNTK